MTAPQALTREQAQEQQAAVTRFIDEHFVECCRELVQLEADGVLGAGRFREAVALANYAGHSAQAAVRGMIASKAIQLCAQMALAGMGRTPPDMACVPKEPTPEMIEAWKNACNHSKSDDWITPYRAMLSAAPAVGQPQPKVWAIINSAGELYTTTEQLCVADHPSVLHHELAHAQEDEPDDGWEIVPLYALPPEGVK